MNRAMTYPARNADAPDFVPATFGRSFIGKYFDVYTESAASDEILAPLPVNFTDEQVHAALVKATPPGFIYHVNEYEDNVPYYYFGDGTRDTGYTNADKSLMARISSLDTLYHKPALFGEVARDTVYLMPALFCKLQGAKGIALYDWYDGGLVLNRLFVVK